MHTGRLEHPGTRRPVRLDRQRRDRIVNKAAAETTTPESKASTGKILFKGAVAV